MKFVLEFVWYLSSHNLGLVRLNMDQRGLRGLNLFLFKFVFNPPNPLQSWYNQLTCNFWVKLPCAREMNHYSIEADFCRLKPLKHPNRTGNTDGWRQYGIGNQKLQHGLTNGTTYPKAHGSCGLVGKYMHKKGMLQKAWSAILWWGQECKTSATK